MSFNLLINLYYVKIGVFRSLDRNDYNHITATYYLLAERKLRSKRQELNVKNRRPEFLAVPQASPAQKKDNGTTPNSSLLSVPRTPGDLPQVFYLNENNSFVLFEDFICRDPESVA